MKLGICGICGKNVNRLFQNEKPIWIWCTEGIYHKKCFIESLTLDYDEQKKLINEINVSIEENLNPKFNSELSLFTGVQSTNIKSEFNVIKLLNQMCRKEKIDLLKSHSYVDVKNVNEKFRILKQKLYKPPNKYKKYSYKEYDNYGMKMFSMGRIVVFETLISKLNKIRMKKGEK